MDESRHQAREPRRYSGMSGALKRPGNLQKQPVLIALTDQRKAYRQGVDEPGRYRHTGKTSDGRRGTDPG